MLSHYGPRTSQGARKLAQTSGYKNKVKKTYCGNSIEPSLKDLSNCSKHFSSTT